MTARRQPAARGADEAQVRSATHAVYTAFIANGFEHSVANMYFIPIALLGTTASAAPFIDRRGW